MTAPPFHQHIMAGVFDLELNEGHSADVETDDDAIEVDQVREVSRRASHSRAPRVADVSLRDCRRLPSDRTSVARRMATRKTWRR